MHRVFFTHRVNTIRIFPYFNRYFWIRDLFICISDSEPYTETHLFYKHLKLSGSDAITSSRVLEVTRRTHTHTHNLLPARYLPLKCQYDTLSSSYACEPFDLRAYYAEAENSVKIYSPDKSLFNRMTFRRASRHGHRACNET